MAAGGWPGCRPLRAAGRAAARRLRLTRHPLLRPGTQDPYGGTGTDEFCLAGPDELRIKTQLRVGGDSVTYTQVYRRRR